MTGPIDDPLVARTFQALTDPAGPERGMELVCELLCELGLGDSALVMIVEPDQLHLRTTAVAMIDSDRLRSFREAQRSSAVRVDSSVTGSAVTTGDVVLLNDIPPDQPFDSPDAFLTFQQRHPTRHLVVVPITVGPVIVGLLVVARFDNLVAFGQPEVERLRSVAAALAYAVERAALVVRLAEANHVLDSIADAVIAVDENRVVTRWNHAAEMIYGIDRSDAIGTSLGDLLHIVSHETALLDEGWDALHDDQTWRDRVRQVTREGRVVDVEAVVRPLGEPGTGFSGAVAVNRDMSRTLAAQRAVAERQAFAEAVLDALPGRTCVIGNDRAVRAVSRRYVTEGPFGDGEGTGPDVGADAMAFLEFQERSRSSMGPVVRALRSALDGDPRVVDTEVPGADDTWTQVHVSSFRGPGGGALLTFVDVSDRKSHELELAHRATHDALTGLPNRALMLDRLRESLGRAHRRGGRVAVLFVDLDGLKSVNDSFGHAAGDELIRLAAERLESSSRTVDTVARVGGDEFVVLLDDVDDAREAETMAERMLAMLREPLEPRPGIAWPAGLSASIGVAIADGVAAPDAAAVEDLVRHADVAMLIAKRAGKDRVVLDTTPVRQSGQDHA